MLRLNALIDNIKGMGKKVLRKGQAPRKTHTELYDRITKIETEVLQRIQKLKSIPKSTLCPHFTVPQPLPEDYIQDKNYFDLYWKQFILNDLGLKHVRKLQNEVGEMQRKMKKIEILFDQRENELKPFQKKRSRSQLDDSDEFSCEECSRNFRDMETLLIHKKIKHRAESQDGRDSVGLDENLNRNSSLSIFQSDEAE